MIGSRRLAVLAAVAVCIVVATGALVGVVVATRRVIRRPEGLVERWLVAISDTGRDGVRADAARRAMRIGPITAAASLVPADAPVGEPLFLDLEVGRGRRVVGGTRVPVRVHLNTTERRVETATVVVVRARSTWVVRAVEARLAHERVASEGGARPTQAGLGWWVGAMTLTVMVTAGSSLVLRAASHSTHPRPHGRTT